MHRNCLLCPAAVRSAAFKPLAEVVGASSQPLLDEAAAIGALASKLAPMVQRAKQLQQEQDHPVAAALTAAASAAAVDAPSSRRRTGGKGGRGDAAAAAAGGSGGKAGSGSDAGEGVEQQVRGMMLEAGASLQQLRELNAALGANGAH